MTTAAENRCRRRGREWRTWRHVLENPLSIIIATHKRGRTHNRLLRGLVGRLGVNEAGTWAAMMSPHSTGFFLRIRVPAFPGAGKVFLEFLEFSFRSGTLERKTDFIHLTVCSVIPNQFLETFPDLCLPLIARCSLLDGLMVSTITVHENSARIIA